jgi:hypothetical protein
MSGVCALKFNLFNVKFFVLVKMLYFVKQVLLVK